MRGESAIVLEYEEMSVRGVTPASETLYMVPNVPTLAIDMENHYS